MSKPCTVENFQTFLSSNPNVVLYVTQESCKVCHPYYDGIIDRAKQELKLPFLRMTLGLADDACTDLARRLDIKNTPTVIIFFIADPLSVASTPRQAQGLP